MVMRARHEQQRPSGNGPSDAALVVAARANEAWAQEALFRRYATMANRMAVRLLGSSSGDVDDLVQDCFLRAFDNLDSLSDPSTFAGWLGRILTRHALNLLRRRRMLERFGLRRSIAVDFDSIPLERAVSPEVAADLRLVYERIDRIDAAARVAFLLRYVEGYELTEVATAMDISLASAKRRIAEAHAQLGLRRDDQRGGRT